MVVTIHQVWNQGVIIAVVAGHIDQTVGLEQGGDRFFALFPHRFDYIYADHPAPAESPHWQTERRHPLGDRLLAQGAYLYGVRFGSQTRYCMLDIDSGSAYHPQKDPLAVSRIVAALEPMGLTSYLACKSSDSGGLHLYFPFSQAQSSWELAAAVTACLENTGYSPRAGQLEVFPNPKPYLVEGRPSLFNAHRLPLQAGSYLLNQDFQPVWGDRQTFVAQWQFAQHRNCVERSVIKRLLRQIRRKHFRISGKADKFINDLNAEIEMGWTGSGQTNWLLGRITMRAYIFHHVLSGESPLSGQALVQQIVDTAQSLPGYREWCGHQHEIEKRAEDWARCIENSRYFHYGLLKGKYKAQLSDSAQESANLEQPSQIASLPTWNQQQSEASRERIRLAIADLLEKDALPARATARFQALTQYGIGGSSLYRHRDLWHPQYLVQSAPVENPPYPPASSGMAVFDHVEDVSNTHHSTSLFSEIGRNPSSGQASGDRSGEKSFSPGSNILEWPGSPQFSQCQITSQCQLNQCQINRHQSSSQRIEQYLASGDPILMAEAIALVNAAHQSAHQPHPSQSCQRQPSDTLSFELTQTSELAQKTMLEQPETWPELWNDRQHNVTDGLDDSDLSDLLAAISVHLRRLQWTKQHIKDCLIHLFGKTDRAQLSPEELLAWCLWLEQEGLDWCEKWCEK